MMKCYDLYCGLGGWAEGFLAEGYEVTGFDVEAHDYGTGGYPGTLVLRDVRSIHGSELADATCIVGSSPCQEFSYRAMPWKRAKALPPPYLGMELFNAQFRIQREASEAAGHYVPMVVENVRGAQKWVGRAQAHYGSFYLWGDVGMVGKRVIAGPPRFGLGVAPGVASLKSKNGGNGSWFAIGGPGQTMLKGNPDGRKVPGVKLSKVGFNVAAVRTMLHGDPNVTNADGRKEGGDWWDKECRKTGMARFGSKSNQRKAASAMIAKIPFPLAQYIARSFREPL